MTTTFPLSACCQMLGVAPKTLRHWLSVTQIEPTAQGTDSRLKLLTLEQVYHLAQLYRRSLSPPGELASEANGQTVAPEPSETLPALDLKNQWLQEPVAQPPLEQELRDKISLLETKLVTVQEQLAHLALCLLKERDLGYERRIEALEARAGSPPEQASSSPLPQEREPLSPLEAREHPGRCAHPAEKRKRSVLSVIEYGTAGGYVMMSPHEGELHLIPDSPEWFAWLASLPSFRFVGQAGRVSVYRDYDEHGPTRSWYASRYFHQRAYKHHLGTTDRLTVARLEQAVAALQTRLTTL